MLSLGRASAASRVASRAFSTSSTRADVAKLTLVGRLVRQPEVRRTRNDKEFVSYSVATTDYDNRASTPEEPKYRSTFHNVFSFNPSSYTYLRSVPKGSLVYVEAGFELREPDPNAEPSSPQGQRQIFLRHESLRLLSKPKNAREEGAEGEGEEFSE
ncbi:nucleic acid-binding protein [Obba rivulosa]|uniref:Nucleic acid-binding protein n=1 Tax=Obba rivulosa TaxID=1052685 RepID=A0A8E2DUL1_9APHY|nr:nucleic acid-binding protein [Obba rivulosa]